MKIRHIALRNLRRNTRRTLLSMTAIAVAAAAFVFLFGIIEGMKADMAYNLQTFVTGQVRLRHAEFDKYMHLNPLHLGVENYGKLTGELEKWEEVEMISPRITFPTAIYKEGETFKARGQGVDFNREIEYQDLEEYVIEGRIPDPGTDEVLVAVGLSEDMGLDIGDNFTLLTQTRGRGMNAITFTVVGLSRYQVSSLNNNFFQAPIERIGYFLRMEESAVEVLLKLAEGVDEEAFITELNGYLDANGRPEVEARGWRTISQTYSFIAMAETIYSIMALFFFILGSTVIVNTMMMTVYERRREIGTINALGMTGPEIVRLFFTEAFFISLAGSFAGVLIGIGATYPASIYGIDFGSALEGVDFEISSRFRPVLNMKSTIFVFFYSTIVASIASLIPSRSSAKVKPVEAMHSI